MNNDIIENLKLGKGEFDIDENLPKKNGEEVSIEELKGDYFELGKFFCKAYTRFRTDFENGCEGVNSVVLNKLIDSYESYFMNLNLLFNRLGGFGEYSIKSQIKDFVHRNYFSVVSFVDVFLEVYE